MGVHRDLTDINEIIIHCADVPNGRGDTVEDINRWHRERGFTRDMSIAPEFNQDLQSIGYHYVIEVTGIIQSGRPLTESGAHVSGHNFNTVGICLIGRDQFTPDQWQSLRQLILDLRALLPAYTSVKGHREYNNNKTCPGFDVRTYAAQDYFPEAAHILKIT